MTVIIEDEEYEVVIEKKRIKNTYIRVKPDLKIYVSTSVFSSEKYVKELIENNIKSIMKMINAQKKRIDKEERFFYLGKEYKVVITNVVKKITFDEDYVYVPKKSDLEKFLIKEAKDFLPKELDRIYNIMNNPKIPYPKVNIKKMTRKWGYNRRSDNLVTLNRELIKYDIDDIDYVIVHELCHFLHFNHSKAFWDSVEYYKPDYKKNKKNLKE